ncbi:MAG: EamA family transporter [Chitinophagaceae bacterium]|jgi:drug/metabolite transporter (DMT)-like permease
MSQQISQTNASKKLVGFAFINIFIIWGSTFLAMSYGLKGFPPFILSGFRFLIAGSILFLWKLRRGESLPLLKSWKRNGITGILILTGGTGLVAWGEQYVSATEAAIAIASGPFWFIIIDKSNWKNYFSDWRIIAGLIAGFIGLILFLNSSIVTGHNSSNHSLRVTAFVILALSSVSWVLGSIYSKNYPAGNSTIMNTAQQLLVAGVASLLISFLRTEWTNFEFNSVPIQAWVGLLFLVFMGSIVAYLSYIWLLQVRPPAVVSTHIYINPIVAVFVGWFFTKQIISTTQLIGLSIIIVGVILTNSGKYKTSIRTKVKIRRGFRISLQKLSVAFHPKFLHKAH